MGSRYKVNMHYHKKIASIPVNNILADGFEFRRERKRHGFQIWMDGELIWDFPHEFADAPTDKNRTNSGIDVWQSTWHNFHLRSLHRFLRLYVDTPRDKLDEITDDYLGLRDLLLAADKRRGRHSAAILMFTTDSAKARKIIHHRFGRKDRAQA